MHIAFIHPHKAFLPELIAYQRYFGERGWKTSEWPAGTGRFPDDVTVEWHFMGMDTAPKASSRKRMVIHEYASGSLPPFYRSKNVLKGWLNRTPDLRVFQSEAVRGFFRFRKETPCVFRDMGVPAEWLAGDAGSDRNCVPPGDTQSLAYLRAHPNADPGAPTAQVGGLNTGAKIGYVPTGDTQNLAYLRADLDVDRDLRHDFIYIGTVDATRNMEPLLDVFTHRLRDRSLLILSRDYAALQKKYAAFPNIRFRGPVPQTEVREAIRASRFALNYFPIKEPFCRLSSTKFLEYLSCGSKIITTRYEWSENFRKQYGGDYFFLEEDLSNLVWEELHRFPYSVPGNIDFLSWEERIKASGIEAFLPRK